MDKLGKLLNRHAISFKVESNLAGNFVKSTTSATHYNVADEIANELNAIKRGQESSNEETAALPLHIVVKSEITLDAKYMDSLGYEVQGLKEAKTAQEKREAWATHLNQMTGLHQENEEYIEREMLKI